MTRLAPRRVAPFGHLGITACVPLPRASRSLPRPSSPPCAQASPTCLPSLDHNRCSSSRTTRIVSTSDVFLRKSHLNKGFINPTIYHASVVKQHRPSLLRGERGQQSRVDGQNVSKRSDYEMLSPPLREVTRDPLRRGSSRRFPYGYLVTTSPQS